jgi:ferredoxin-NADP reductase
MVAYSGHSCHGYNGLHVQNVRQETKMNYKVKILKREQLNHNMVRYELEKPANYSFNPGQAIELTLTEPEAKGPAPFTFTSLTTSPNLELMIKTYPEHNGITQALSKKKVGDTVIIGDPWDSFINKGPGVFIAGGAGITPFVAILRDLKQKGTIDNSFLFFFNKTQDDLFLSKELNTLLGDRFISIITRNDNKPRDNRLDGVVFRKHVRTSQQPFYVCGPPGFMENIQRALTELGAKEELVNVSF